ncbi:MAG: alpha/beta fold hydrolase [Cyanobacteria bacterium J083]|nr:MAG: alpha/beta fold hydrolase [Cyanobacteria bacterium J083]
MTFQFYTWNGYQCAYKVNQANSEQPAILLIHPIGVGLSGVFWERFITTWRKYNHLGTIYNPDLLGCGASDKPRIAYYPEDWAEQIAYFLVNFVKKPVFVLVQGALFPVAIALSQYPSAAEYIKGFVLSGPPAWRIMSQAGKPLQQKLLWNLLFDSPLGTLFYRYARRRQFLQSFSVRQLFAKAEEVDANWLNFLEVGAQDLATRYAVFAFLAGFWRKDYTEAIQGISQPTLAVFGKQASSISKSGIAETPSERVELYQKYLPRGEACIIPGRNVLPYENPPDFVQVTADFMGRRES